MAPAWWGIDPLTPACPEIIEPYSVPDCMLSWCGPNLFHSLIRRFVCRKGTGWAVPGGMTSTVLLLCWCHMEFVSFRRKIQPTKAWQGFGLLSDFDKQLRALEFVIVDIGSNSGLHRPLALFICDQSYVVLQSIVVPSLEYSTQSSFQIVFFSANYVYPVGTNCIWTSVHYCREENS